MSDPSRPPSSSRRRAPRNPYSQEAANKSLAEFLASRGLPVPSPLKRAIQSEDHPSHSNQKKRQKHGKYKDNSKQAQGTLALVSDDIEEHAKPITFDPPTTLPTCDNVQPQGKMDATAVQPQPQHRPLFDATTVTNLKPRISSSSNVSVLDANKEVAPADPAAFRARLKHRGAPPTSNSTANTTTTTTTGAYDRVLDTARRLAELESQRSQDQIYIRTLEQTRATLVRDAQSTARARAEAERAVAGERDARRRREEAEAARDEAVRVVGVERARAEMAEGRVGEVENRLRVSEARVSELEDALEEERKRRVEWESGLEALV